MGRIGKKQHKWIIIFNFWVSFVLKSLSTESRGRLSLLLPSHVCYLVAEVQVISMEELSWYAKTFCLWGAFNDGHSQSKHVPIIAMVWKCVLIYIMCFVQILYRVHLFFVRGISAGHICLGGLGLWQGLQGFSLWVRYTCIQPTRTETSTYSHWDYLSKMGHESKRAQALEQPPSTSCFSLFINS